MSNIMSYLLQQTDEFRDSYSDLEKRLDEILEKLEVVDIRMKELEARVNLNRNDNE
tara:strand:- start:109 stop:276 length:168 start_codon:yes stop_codon:yes gene_type:complete